VFRGLGGRVEPGESDAQAAIREVLEESGGGDRTRRHSLRAAITYLFPAKPSLDARVAVFFGNLVNSGRSGHSSGLLRIGAQLGIPPSATAARKPAVVTSAVNGPPSSWASGSIVDATIVSTAPAANPRIAPTTSGGECVTSR
jgi:hypothetical protein